MSYVKTLVQINSSGLILDVVKVIIPGVTDGAIKISVTQICICLCLPFRSPPAQIC